MIKLPIIVSLIEKIIKNGVKLQNQPANQSD